MNEASLRSPSVGNGDFHVKIDTKYHLQKLKKMATEGRRALSPAAAKELGEQRESWCAVEMKKEQSWDRKNRKHYDEILQSTVFDIKKPQYEPRCTFEVNAPTHRERRHYGQHRKLFMSNYLI